MTRRSRDTRVDAEVNSQQERRAAAAPPQPGFGLCRLRGVFLPSCVGFRAQRQQDGQSVPFGGDREPAGCCSCISGELQLLQAEESHQGAGETVGTAAPLLPVTTMYCVVLCSTV